jgi:hypothetical protein
VPSSIGGFSVTMLPNHCAPGLLSAYYHPASGISHWKSEESTHVNSLLEPPFAKDPPVKVNVNAKTLGLVLLILGAIGILVNALGLIGIFGFCGTYSVYGGCGLPVLWLLGDLIGLAAVIIGTMGAYRMYQGNREGKLPVIYGLILGVAGAVITLIGNLAAYSGLIGVGAGGTVVFSLVIDLIVYFVVYYLVVVSRFPGEAPLSPPSATTWGGGPSAPPPPPLA